MLATRGRGTLELDPQLERVVRASGVALGLCHLFLRHTSAALVLCENADPQVRADLEAWLARAVPDGDPLFRHRAEGPDDMPAHVRSILTGCSLTLPVVDGRLDLGTWQSVYLYEHRSRGQRRTLRVTLQGEPGAGRPG